MTGKVLITGASGGFGREFALQLEPMGFDLLLLGRDLGRLKLVQAELSRPERHRLLQADLNCVRERTSLIEKLEKEKITGLVNNAGFGIWGGFFECVVSTQIGVVQTNLVAPIHLTHALLPQLVRQHGFIINVSSLAGETPLPYMSTYASAKAGLTFWSEALRLELGSQGVHVVTLVPGPSPTGFRDVSGMTSTKGSFFRTPSKTVVQGALACLARGGGYCIPGWRHTLLFGLQKMLPQRLALQIMKRHLRP
ncbi:MAG: SDR family NAD(P)-dependent oxidoreductase [Mariprofundaceae bacterium]